MRRGLLIALCTFLFPYPALAADSSSSPPEEPKKNDDHHDVYISFSPLHLLFPVFEATAEFRLHERVGVAATGGIGSIRIPELTNRVTVYEFGGQFVGYPVGGFDHGMQLGAEVMFVGASASEGKVDVLAQGLSLGPFIGYKLATKVGFSFNIQAGFSYVAVRGSGQNHAGETSSAEASAFAPLLNLNVGWSF
jgi:hypothetical protein